MTQSKPPSPALDVVGDVGHHLLAEHRFLAAAALLNVVAEQYPDLKANQNFMDLSAQLKKTEEDIANARKYYNAVVKQYNNLTQMFPSSIVASMFRFEKRDMFIVEDTAQREAVKVEF